MEEELNRSDKIKENIRFNTEMLRLLIIGLISVGGGTISLINDGHLNGGKVFFITSGLLLSTGLIAGFIMFLNAIKQQIK